MRPGRRDAWLKWQFHLFPPLLVSLMLPSIVSLGGTQRYSTYPHGVAYSSQSEYTNSVTDLHQVISNTDVQDMYMYEHVAHVHVLEGFASEWSWILWLWRTEYRTRSWFYWYSLSYSCYCHTTCYGALVQALALNLSIHHIYIDIYIVHVHVWAVD